jgi:hypothetical protein
MSRGGCHLEFPDAEAKRAHFRHLAVLSAESRRARRTMPVDERIRELVEKAPPLTSSQRDRIAALLRSA